MEMALSRVTHLEVDGGRFDFVTDRQPMLAVWPVFSANIGLTDLHGDVSPNSGLCHHTYAVVGTYSGKK